MDKIIDPWGSELPEDYVKIVKDFGLEAFDKSMFPEPNRLMRRGIIFAGRDLKVIAHAIREKKPFYALSGIMPTNDKIHLGNKAVVEQLKYFQGHGAKTYILVADLEAAAARGVSVEEGRKRALEFHIPAYIALGLDPKKTVFYFQSQNMEVVRLGYEFAQRITLNEFKAIYGSAEPGRIMSAVTQVGDILFPQLERRMPGIIPIGLDQDPHIRLSRDIVSRTKAMKFVAPSSIYHKYMPALNGDLKMSKSNPMASISLPEDASEFRKKIQKALTGGRDTLEEQKRLGAVIEKDMVFELLKQHLVEDDDELDQIYRDYKSGRMMSGEIKQLAIEKMEKFMNDFSRKLEKARKDIGKVNILSFRS